MSRYSLKPLAHRSDVFEVAVGWDAGFSTYFVIVFGGWNEEDDPEFTNWRGAKPDQIPTVFGLRNLVEQYAELPPGLVLQLQADQRAEPGPMTQPFNDFLFRLL